MIFEPEQPVDIREPKAIVRWVFDQFVRLAELLASAEDERILLELHREPPKPREGMIVFADGTDWDPGSGKGFYGYHGGSWNFLG